jgi:hypothetical protein
LLVIHQVSFDAVLELGAHACCPSGYAAGFLFSFFLLRVRPFASCRLSLVRLEFSRRSSQHSEQQQQQQPDKGQKRRTDRGTEE